jgi:hypothetical protein
MAGGDRSAGLKATAAERLDGRQFTGSYSHILARSAVT